MRNRASWPLIFNGVGLLLVLIPGASFLRVIGAVSLLLVLPGYAVSVALFGPDRPMGAAAVVALAVSVSVTGIGGFALALAGVFNRPEIIAVDAAVGLGAGSVAAWRFRGARLQRRSVNHLWKKALVVTGGGIGIAILVVAFALDVTSARQAQKQTSVALSAVSAGKTLKIEVQAPDNVPFSGTVELTRATPDNPKPRTITIGPSIYVLLGQITGPGGQYSGYNVRDDSPVYFGSPTSGVSQLSGPSAIADEPVGTDVYTPTRYANLIILPPSTSRTVVRIWTVKKILPGSRWSPASAVRLSQGENALQLILSRYGSPVRVLQIGAPARHAGASR
jgi:hypothetical protein